MLKQLTSYREQIEKLRERGCIIKDETLCEDILSRVGYYRLTGFFLPFKTANGTYRENLDFLKVYRVYEFDRKLRGLMFSAVEEVEVFLRTKIAYYHADKYGANGYLDPLNYNGKHKHSAFLNLIATEVKKNSSLAFVQHHISRYNGQFPIWVLMELFTFGMLSNFYADLIQTDQKQIARDLFGTIPKNVISWLRCCKILRNLCAHYGRLYYTIFSAIPAKLPAKYKNAERQLFGVVFALRQIYPVAAKWNAEILASMASLLKEYSDVVELSHMGFPSDWDVVLRK